MTGASDVDRVPTPSPERAAANLALRARADASGPFLLPGPGSADARVDLKLAAWQTEHALATRGTAAARQRLAGLDAPDLVAGTVQDGTARGLLLAYEEALALCSPAPAEDDPFTDPLTRVLEGKPLRKQREHVIESGGARVRFARKCGVHLIDRDAGVNLEHSIAFEDQTDLGTLDGFLAKEGERPRLFSPAFLQPVAVLKCAAGDRLELKGRLGRTPHGYPCTMTIEGRRDERSVRVVVRVENRHPDHRLRIRFMSVPPALISSEGTPALTEIAAGHRRFVVATIVRACGMLTVGMETVAVPGAQVFGWIEHRFRLGEQQ
jgi:hypothetical protein